MNYQTRIAVRAVRFLDTFAHVHDPLRLFNTINVTCCGADARDILSVFLSMAPDDHVKRFASLYMMTMFRQDLELVAYMLKRLIHHKRVILADQLMRTMWSGYVFEYE